MTSLESSNAELFIPVGMKGSSLAGVIVQIEISSL